MFRKIALSFIVFLAFPGCLSVTQGPPPSLLFSQFQGPIAVAPNAERLGEKSGEACAMNILGLVAIGDASLDTAARNANIQKISTLSYSFMNVLGALFSRYCLLVTGE